MEIGDPLFHNAGCMACPGRLACICIQAENLKGVRRSPLWPQHQLDRLCLALRQNQGAVDDHVLEAQMRRFQNSGASGQCHLQMGRRRQDDRLEDAVMGEKIRGPRRQAGLENDLPVLQRSRVHPLVQQRVQGLHRSGLQVPV